MSFVRAACVAAFACVSMACTSANFNTAPAGPAEDTGTAPADSTGTDGSTDPCAPIKDIAKFCVNVAKVDTHPGYDSASGKDALGIDGVGTLKVYLYNEDPGDATRKTPIKPIVTIPYPSGGATIGIDKDLPLSVADSAPEGHYWFTVVFEDNDAAARPDTYAAVPGDFIAVPPVVDNKLMFPEVTLVKGETKPIPVTLKPFRQVAATVQASAALVAIAKVRTEIHGDGPMAFVVYRGDLGTPSATYFDLAYTHCIDLKPRIGETIPVSFGTILAEGNYKVLAALFDYDYPSPTGGKNDFPGKGTIVSPLADGPVAKVPIIAISPTRWLTTINVDMVDVPIAPGTITERQICPGAK